MPTPCNTRRKGGCLSWALNPAYAGVERARNLHHCRGRELGHHSATTVILEEVRLKSKMRIGIDRQTFTIQKYGGISRYFSDLYLGLRQRPEVEAELLFSWHQNAYLHEKGIGKNLHPFAAKCYIKAVANANPSLPLTRHHDIHHSTYYLGKPEKNNSNTRLVSTLYDMIPELLPSFFRGNQSSNKLHWFEASDLIISISDTAAEDLAYFQPRLAGRIRRIHLYSAFSAETPQSRPVQLGESDKPYLLFVGYRGGYKNASMLLRAFAASEPSRHGHQLLLAGGGVLRKEEFADIARLRITDYVQQISISDGELWYLYKNARAVLVPSMYEGFSLPVVEGLAADIPVICSDIPVHREVGGDFAEFINPLHYQDWAEIFRTVETLKRPSQKIGIKEYGKKKVYFSRERMVLEHVNTYRSILC
jgi:glycosyltransferase involved in cell wall biosynthesis